MLNRNKQQRVIWKDVYLQGVKSSYQVSNKGDVKNKHTKKSINQYSNTDGSLSVYLECNGRGYKLRVHQLVAKAFIPNPVGWICVKHKDGDRINNNILNLEWDDKRAWV